MKVSIIGCGGNSKIVIDICILNGYEIVGIFDDKYDSTPFLAYRDVNVIGKINDIPNKIIFDAIVNSIGDGNVREKIYQQLSHLNLNWINCIHPLAYISPSVKLGIGNIVCIGAVINSDTVIGNHNLINTYAVVEHDCQIDDFNHLAPKSTLCGSIIVGSNNLISAGATIIPNHQIGNKNIIGAMAVVITDIQNNNTIVGVPGRTLTNK